MFRRFISYYKPYKKVFYLDMFCAFIVALTAVAFPVLIRKLTRDIFVNHSGNELFGYVLQIAGIMLVLYIIEGLAQYYVTSHGHIMGAKIERDMRSDLFSHLQKLSFSYYDRENTGEIMSRILADLFDITELAHHGPENIVLSAVQIIGAFIFLLTINLRVTAVLFVVTLGMIIFSVRYNKKMRRTFMNNRRRVADINAVAQDSLSGIRTVASFTNEELEYERFDENNKHFLDSKRENYLVMGRYHSINGFLQGMMYLSVILTGGWMVAHNQMHAGDVVIYILYISMFLNPVRRLVQFTEQFQKGYTGFIRVVEILDTEPEIKDAPDAIEVGKLEGHIEFDHVDFAYEPGKPIFQDLTLDIPARQTVALVGPSGAGKTSFVSLIPRFYEINDGSISVDGTDIRKMTLNSLRRNIGIVQQDVYIFNTTVRENIAYGKPHASDEEIIAAAKRARIHDDIMQLKNGYDTMLGERGVRFSGGQKQRLSIARIFLQNPPILILDEATSALDNESEVLIQESLDELAHNRSTLVIAHRLSTIKNADQILVLTEEGIVERGSHAELMETDGLYAQLYRLQFRDN